MCAVAAAETHITAVPCGARGWCNGIGVVATNPYFQHVEFVVLLLLMVDGWIILDGAREKICFDVVFLTQQHSDEMMLMMMK